LENIEITLFVNGNAEDFLTSDHPVTQCNNLPASSPHGANIGFASRGLIIALPLSPRALLFLSDPEVYKVAKDAQGVSAVTTSRDVVDLNLAQCFNAHDNLYFASPSNVEETLNAFRKREAILRPQAPALTEKVAIGPDGRKAVLLEMPGQVRRMNLPKAVEIRHAARKGKYRLGDAFARDPLRTAVVKQELDRLQKLREEATRKAEVGAASGGVASPARRMDSFKWNVDPRMPPSSAV
jgi:hypothetical protein